jgi:O-antigen ligase
VQAALGIYAFLIPFDDIAILASGGATGPTLTRFAGAAATVILLLTGLANRRLVRPPRAALWMSLFILWSIASITWAVNEQLSLERLPTLLSLFLLYLIVSSFRLTEKELQWVVALAILGAVVAGASVIATYFQGNAYMKETGRATFIVGQELANPNKIANKLLLPFSLALSGLFATRNWLRQLICLTAISVMILAVFLTISRGAILALGVILLLYFHQFWVNWRFWVATVIVGLAVFVMPEYFFTRFQQAAVTGGANRLEIWQQGLEGLKHYGAWGMGLENSPIRYSTERGVISDPHNVYLGVWLQTGIVGLCLFVMAIVSYMRDARLWRNVAREGPRMRLIGFEAAGWGMMVAGMFLFYVWQKDFWLLWMLLGIAVQVQKDAAAEAQLL